MSLPVGVIIAGCHQARGDSIKERLNNDTPFEVILPAHGEISGSILVAHGLNNTSQAMQSFGELFSKLSLAAIYVKFSGHRAGSPIDGVTSEKWINDFKTAYLYAGTTFPEKPVYCLGYSLGGAAALALLKRESEVKFEKLLLLSPAVSLKFRSWAVRLLTIFDFTGLSLPSFTPREFRANSSLSLKAYSALFDLVDYVEKVDAARFSSVPVLAIFTEGDELISASGFKSWQRQNGLEGWQTVMLKPEPEEGAYYNHLLYHRASLGSAVWERLIYLAEGFLKRP